MTQSPEGERPAGVPTCYRHPGIEAHIACQRCERHICPDCMYDAAVGFQCRDCIRQGARDTRQGLAMYGGQRSSDPRLTSFFLIGINAVVWLAIMATGGGRSRLVDLLALSTRGRCVSTSEPGMWFPGVDSEQICSLATRGDGLWQAGVSDGAWWQVVTAVFTHVEIWHIALNMMALYFIGPMLESILGRARFLAVYAVGGLTGSLLVLWLSDPAGSTLGASGAIFGLLGGLLVTFKKAKRDTQWLMQNLLLGVVITVVGWNHISWQGHLGGLLGGAAAAAVITFAPKSSRSLVQWVGIAALLVLVVGLSVVRALTYA